MKTPSPNHCTGSTVPPDAIWRNWYLWSAWTGYMDTKLSGRFSPSMPAVLGFEYGLHSELPHPQDLRTDPPHYGRYRSNSTVPALPSKPFCPLLASVSLWNHVGFTSLHYKPVLTVTIPKGNSTVWFPSWSFSCRILACITVELRSPRGWCPLLWSSSGKFTHLYPHWHSITVSPFSDPSPRASYSLLTPTATAYFLRKRGLAQNFLISFVHLEMVLCFVTCFLFLFCPVGVLSLKRDIINTDVQLINPQLDTVLAKCTLKPRCRIPRPQKVPLCVFPVSGLSEVTILTFFTVVLPVLKLCVNGFTLCLCIWASQAV